VKATTWFFGTSFHAPREPAAPAPAPKPYVDTRPRFTYRLPDGSTIRVIRDHGETPPEVITHQIAGRFVTATLVLGPTPETLTFDELTKAVDDKIVTFADAWAALDDVGTPARDAARKRICEAIAKRGSVS